MTDPITLQLRQTSNLTELEIQIMHPMEAGDELPSKSKKARKPRFLQSMVIQLNERSLLDGQLSASLSRNPRFVFSFADIKAGDRFSVLCINNEGTEFRSEVVAP
ncbi:MAG TPA: thiosulfate oxidation carrier complex protein SoxZ [Gallionella sp.]|nr:thiosulfate oxidation carrier complex protein SoxZ [Gallionella sp.]